MMFLATRLGDLTVEDMLLIFPIMIGVAIVFGAICFVIKGKENRRNNTQPVQRMTAVVVDVQKPGPGEIALQLWVMFEVADGRRVRLVCKANHDYVIGDRGYLQWQGTRFLSFERSKVVR